MGVVPKSGQELLPPKLDRVKYSTLRFLRLDEGDRARQDHQAIGNTLGAGRVQLDCATPSTLCLVVQVLFD
jgi:hypothetical protein